VDKELLDKFFNYQCTKAEEKKVKAWLSLMKRDLKDISSIEKAWFDFEPPKHTKQWDKASLFKKIDQSIDVDRLNKHKGKVRPLSREDNSQANMGIKSKYFSTISYVAAVTMALLVAGFLFYAQNENLPQPISESKIATLTKHNPKGQKTTLKLPDGTKVKLNAESSLIFPEKFGQDERVVTLKGEAFFDVKKDTKRPFIIKVGDLEAKVLGTSFNINAFPESDVIDIALLTGKLVVHPSKNKNKASVLLPTENLLYNKQTEKISKSHFDADQVLAWKHGILLFKEANLLEITKKLERWYGCSFDIKQGLDYKNSIAFTGRFENKSLKEVLEGLSLATNLNYKLKDKKVFFY